ncbi:MAG: glycosyltransferase family 4 protein [Clostridia bacterium]|nr:glycosyltransferase family 4 protein [Clostridia bacterium]
MKIPKIKTVYFIASEIESLNCKEMTSSSQKYKYWLAHYLSKYINVKIISICAPRTKREKNGNLELVGTDEKKYGKRFKFLNILSELKNDGQVVIIFWGYDLFFVLGMLYIKLFKKQICIPFEFDSHKPAMCTLTGLKRAIINLKFSIGKFFIRFFKGIIVFQEKAINRFAMEGKHTLVLKPSVITGQPSIYNQCLESFEITFAGTFTELNGIDALISSLEGLKDLPIQINLCGDGPLLKQVLEAEKRYDFFHYKGRLAEEELYDIYKKSSLLLNLRRLDDEAMDYAFPSKTFECINTGIPLLTTRVLEDKEFLENVFIIDDITPRAIAEKIRYIYNNKELAYRMANAAKKYVDGKYSFESAAKKLVKFINAL